MSQIPSIKTSRYQPCHPYQAVAGSSTYQLANPGMHAVPHVSLYSNVASLQPGKLADHEQYLMPPAPARAGVKV